MKRKYETRKTNHKSRKRSGSALILTVVLTTLLAIVGVAFLLASRINKMAASAASENRELNSAVDTVVAKIKQELVLDVPGVDPNVEYYDYPDANNAWLAALELYKSGSNYYWPQISDLYYKLGLYSRNMLIGIIPDYQDTTKVGDSNSITIYPADADGDGVGDSMWIKLSDITSGKGKPIYVAIRIVDNGGMINVNTAYKFDPTDPCSGNIDGSSQLQVNLMALAGRPPLPSWPVGIPYTSQEENLLLSERDRYGIGAGLNDYENFVIWSYGELAKAYTPFDISDELELRYRFLLNHEDIDTRLEGWGGEFRNATVLSTPVTSGGLELNKWFKRAHFDPSILDMTDPKDPNYYAYRHIATTCNMDRIINPAGPVINNGKMVNINTADKNSLYSAIYAGLYDANTGSPSAIMPIAAQLAVNIIDLRDDDADVTILPPLSPGEPNYYGFEAQPFISEIAFKIDGNDPIGKNDFALELYNPFEVPIPLSDFRLELRRPSGGVAKTINLAGYMITANSWFVITNGPAASTDFGVTGLMSTGRGKQDPNLVLAKYKYNPDGETYELDETYDDIYLLRKNPGIYLDRSPPISSGFIFDYVKNVQQFYYREDPNWNIIYQEELFWKSSGTLGAANGGGGTSHNYNIPTFHRFVTVGDIARVLTIGPGPNPSDTIGAKLAAASSERNVRIDLATPAFQQIFNYLTVFDPAVYPWNDPNETRAKGRININTAPWFVIAQLPWIRPELAQAIIAYRDKLNLRTATAPNRPDYYQGGASNSRQLGMQAPYSVRESPGFAVIGELLNVTQDVPLALADPPQPSGDPLSDIRRYGRDSIDQQGFPDLTTHPVTRVDGATDDFEERDVIFARISNLVTVRSDVFTAYILVRIGTNGPQRRVIAILDRSQVPAGKVKIVAIQPVPDPR